MTTFEARVARVATFAALVLTVGSKLADEKWILKVPAVPGEVHVAEVGFT